MFFPYISTDATPFTPWHDIQFHTTSYPVGIVESVHLSVKQLELEANHFLYLVLRSTKVGSEVMPLLIF